MNGFCPVDGKKLIKKSMPGLLCSNVHCFYQNYTDEGLDMESLRAVSLLSGFSIAKLIDLGGAYTD